MVQIIKDKQYSVDEIVLKVMQHFGFRRNYQVAEYFNVTPQTLSGWIKSGDIPNKHVEKFSLEILNIDLKDVNETSKGDNYLNDSLKHSSDSILNTLSIIILSNFKIIFLIPLFFAITTTFYVYYISDQIYTSKSKVLPISEDGSTSNNFSGFASQLGISMPINIGGKVPWDEIYPEILKSSDLLDSMLEKRYDTKKYGEYTLKDILISENNLHKYSELDQKNRVIDKLRKMIKISKDRTSPIVNIEVMTFEPIFASELSKDLIQKSSQIQRQLKTNRIKNKRLFIEERLKQVEFEMQNMETTLRVFRENNRNLSTSPTLQMKVQEMGREVDLQNSLYVTLKTQYEKAKIDEVGRDDMVQQIDGPSIPTQLTSPKRLLSVLMSIFLDLEFPFLSFI